MEAVHVVGAGGIGCAVASALRLADWPVTIVETSAAKLTAGALAGVGVIGRDRRPAHFVSFAEWQPPENSLVLLCTKCYDNAAVLARVPATARIVPVQNGFDDLLDQRGHDVEAIASFVSECLSDQPLTRITRPGDLHIGPRGGSAPAWLTPLATALAVAKLFRVRVVPDVRPFKYTKLLYNAAISPLAAAAGLDNGDLLRLPLARQLFFGLIRENYAILHGAGKPLGKVGPFHPATVQAILRRGWLARGMAFAFYPSLRGTYCSMAGDIKTGRTEIGNYNERLVAWAGPTPCPRNQKVVSVIRRLESSRAKPDVNVLAEFVV